VFYTDGLTEATRNPLEGEEQLLAILHEGSVLSARHPAQALRDAVFAGDTAKDDVAILVMGIDDRHAAYDAPAADGALERRAFDALDAVAAQAARRAFTDGLRARAADAASIAKAEVVFGELVGNVARYAPGIVEVTVDWSGPDPVLHVLDRGPGFHHVPALPRDVYAESGRGLFIIALSSEDFSVAKRPDGGSHARAVLALKERRSLAGP
jgi:anti-sigma regulatory factor (Ser/Thr protein kinase)